MKNKYWMVADQDKTIWGIGITPVIAIMDAKESIDSVVEEDRVDVELMHSPIPCTKSLFDQVYDNGATKEDTWTIINGLATLDCEVNEKENCEEMRSLIDGAYEIIYMYPTTTKAQVQWKQDWLKKAKKYGAGFNE